MVEVVVVRGGERDAPAGWWGERGDTDGRGGGEKGKEEGEEEREEERDGDDGKGWRSEFTHI